MTSIDLNDPHITMAYDAIAHNDPLRWFLVGFDKNPTELRLFASGVGDIEELRSQIKPGHICYGLFREPGRGGTLRLSISYIPNSLRGVYRARALVHGKTVANRFTSHEQLTVSEPEELTVQAIRAALHLPPRVDQVSTSSDSGEPVSLPTPSPPRQNHNVYRKPIPELYPPSPQLPNEPALQPTLMDASPIPLKLSMDASSPHLPAPDLLEKQETSAYAEDAFATHDSGRSSPTSPAEQSSFLPPQSTTSPLSPGVLAFISANMPASMAPSSPPLSAEIPSPTYPAVPTSVTPSWLAKQAAPLPRPPDEPDDSDTPSSQGKSDDSWHRSASPDVVSIPDSHSLRSIPSSEHGHAAAPSTQEKPVDGLPPVETESVIDHFVEPDPGPSRFIDGLPKTLPSLPPPEPTPETMSPSVVASSFSSPPRSGFSSARQSYDKPLPSQRHAPPLSTVSPPERSSSRFYTRPSSAGQDSKPISPIRGSPSSFGSPPERSSSRFYRRPLSVEQEEEERKLAVLEEERRRRQAERAKREKEEREEEEARQREFAERKEKERLRRVENARKAEEKRIEMLKLQEEEEARRKAEKQKKEEETQRRRKDIGEQLVKQAGMDLMSGFITLESGSSWKRRYYRLSTEQWVFYKSDRETINPIHVIDLSQVTALKEWSEGYEELESIPHSFAVEIRDESPCLFYADSSEDKEIILGLLNQAAGL